MYFFIFYNLFNQNFLKLFSEWQCDFLLDNSTQLPDRHAEVKLEETREKF